MSAIKFSLFFGFSFVVGLSRKVIWGSSASVCVNVVRLIMLLESSVGILLLLVWFRFIIFRCSSVVFWMSSSLNVRSSCNGKVMFLVMFSVENKVSRWNKMFEWCLSVISFFDLSSEIVLLRIFIWFLVG